MRRPYQSWQIYIRRTLRRASVCSRRQYTRAGLLLLACILVLDSLSLLWTSTAPSTATSSRASSTSTTSIRDPSRKIPKIFLSSTHWNNEPRLRSFWNAAVLALVDHLGPENIYVSIYESGSWDDSKGALRELDARLEELGVQRTIYLGNVTHADEIAQGTPSPQSSTSFKDANDGWIDTPRGMTELRRIPFLAKLRNLSLKPMERLALNGIRFEKVLFLNDVAFTVSKPLSFPSREGARTFKLETWLITKKQTRDIMTLLETHGGSYAAACALDFMHSPNYYDTFALRDSEGYETVMSSFPYFRSRASRNAMMADRPVPVQSCWNGAVVFDAAPFYNGMQALRFRGIPDSLADFHLEGSECCLIHADNPLTKSRGIWVNPDVRVAYSQEAYDAVNPTTGQWPAGRKRIVGIWQNRFRRWFTFTMHKSWRISGRVVEWEKLGLDQEQDPAPQCLINEMQVLVENGWKHV
ncbi:hypothetical protein MMC25_000741 [Agyrium rufum]|nr:hypothetical protein [Agyrium rufum]